MSEACFERVASFGIEGETHGGLTPSGRRREGWQGRKRA
jgi:hypothetical protein